MINKNYITQNDLSSKDITRIQTSQVIAVDCEMAGLNPHRDPLYLVQISDKDKIVTILKNHTWTEAKHLQEVISNPNIQKIFHFAIMDCGFLQVNLNVPLRNIYCTKIASKLARTYAPTHNLSVLVEELLGIVLDKKQRSTFWGNTMLSREQLEYATADVLHLIDLQKKLEEILDSKGRLPTGITYLELNRQCQELIPTLVHLWLNGWDFGKEDPESIFGR